MDVDTLLKRTRILDWMNMGSIESISKFHQNNFVRELETEEKAINYFDDFNERGIFKTKSKLI